MWITNLNYIHQIAEFHSLTDAAAAMHISQQRLSYIISSIEAEFGIKIFERGRKGIYLTEDGSEFIKYTQRILNTYSDMQTIKHNYVPTPSLTIGFDQRIDSDYLKILLDSCAASPTKIKYTCIQKEDPVELLDALAKGNIDMAVSISLDKGLLQTSNTETPKKSAYQVKALAEGDFYVLHHKNRMVSNTELPTSAPLVFRKKDTSLKSFFRYNPNIDIFLEAESTDLLLSCIQGDHAVGFMDSFTIAHIDFAQKYPYIRLEKFQTESIYTPKFYFYYQKAEQFPGYYDLITQVEQKLLSDLKTLHL